jgi:apolipoprotein N-acyltransferase
MESIATLEQPDRAQLRTAYTMVENALFMVSQREANAGAKIISWPEIEVSTLPEDETSLIARGQALARKEHIYLEMAYSVVQQD